MLFYIKKLFLVWISWLYSATCITDFMLQLIIILAFIFLIFRNKFFINSITLIFYLGAKIRSKWWFNCQYRYYVNWLENSCTLHWMSLDLIFQVNIVLLNLLHYLKFSVEYADIVLHKTNIHAFQLVLLPFNNIYQETYEQVLVTRISVHRIQSGLTQMAFMLSPLLKTRALVSCTKEKYA